MKTIVLATNNAHKLQEIKDMMQGYSIVSLQDIGFVGDIAETGTTMEANAKIKSVQKNTGRMQFDILCNRFNIFSFNLYPPTTLLQFMWESRD